MSTRITSDSERASGWVTGLFSPALFAARVPIGQIIQVETAKSRFITPDGKPYPLKLHTQQHSSPTQPFDRTMPKFEVYLHTFSIASSAPPVPS